MAPSTIRGPRSFLLGLLIALMVLGWSFNFVAGKIALRYFDPFTLASFRIVLAGLLMVPIYFVTPRRQRFERRDFWTFGVLGFFGVVMNQGCFTIGLSYTTAGHSSIIVAIGPILVLLLACLLGLESLTAGKIFGMAASFSGVAVLAAENGVRFHSAMLAGDLITLAGSTGFALYTVLGKKVARRYNTVAMNTFNCLAAAAVVLPLAIHQAARLDWQAVRWPGWVGMAYMAVISSVAAYLVYYWALRYIAASRLAAVSYFQPLLVILLGVAFLGERFTPRLALGSALVLVGVSIVEHVPGGQDKEAEPVGK